MKYKVSDKPPMLEMFIFAFQIVVACFPATILIPQICNQPVSAALVGVGIATLIYVIITKFQSPMIISNSGAYVTPVIAAYALGGCSAIMLGGIVSCIVYCIFGLVFYKVSADSLYKVFPTVLIGSVTCVIGINLMSYIPSYIGTTQKGLAVALFTVLIIAITSHYLKGTISLYSFLIGIGAGYALSIPLGLVDFSVFEGVKFIQLPKFAFSQFTCLDIKTVPSVVLLFLAFTISAMMEALSDHAALGNIIGQDLYKNPGLTRIFFGEGVANLLTSFFGGLGACSYGEGIGTVGFSKCASIYTTLLAAIMMIILGVIGPVQAFIASIPTQVLGGGLAVILYGYISNSGIKLLQTIDFNNQKNLLISSVVMSLGISGVVLGNKTISFSGTALALIAGVVLNLVLKDKSKPSKPYRDCDNVTMRYPEE